MLFDCFYKYKRFERFMFIKIAIGECDFKSINFRLIFSIYMHATTYFNLIKHNIVTFISLSLFHYRHHLIIKIWHFLFFVSNCHETSKSC